MNQQQIIENAKQYIKELFKNESSGHDYFHSMRVYNTAMTIVVQEEGDRFLVALAALLHDVDDRKLFGTHETLENARNFMSGQGVSEEQIEKVCEMIKTVSFSGGKVPSTLEGKIVQDADRLDAIGAIGIARAFAFGGNKGRTMYDPEEKPAMNMTKEEYENHVSTTVNHFYEKLLKLKDMVNTEAAGKIAEERHTFMEQFLNEFYEEWNGKR